MVWSTGATSRLGSLGAPLFDNRTQQVVGVLVGSTSSCTTPGRPDYFGRLSAVRPHAFRRAEVPKTLEKPLIPVILTIGRLSAVRHSASRKAMH